MARGAVIDDLSDPGEVRELAMSVGGDDADAGTWGTDAPVAVGPDGQWWRTRWPVAVVAVVAAVAALVVLVGRPDARPVATVNGWPELFLEDVPARVPIERWTLDLGTRDEVALVDDRVIVAAARGSSFTGPTNVSARNVRSKNLLWEREVPDAVSLGVVDSAGRLIPTMQSPFGPGDDPSRRLLVVSSDDGRVLWDRPPDQDRWLAANVSGGLVLVGAMNECELVHAATGDIRWAGTSPWCTWLDPTTFVVQHGEDWEVRDLDGDLLLSTSAVEDGPPVVAGDLLVTLDDRDVTAHDRTGAVRWRATTAFDADYLWSFRGVGIVAVRYDQDGDTEEQEGWDLEGAPLDSVDDLADDLGIGLPVDVDGSTYVLDQAGVDGGSIVTLDPLEGGETTTVTSRDVNNGAFFGLTRHGLLAVTIDEPPMLEFRAWPSREVTWSVPLPESVDQQELMPMTVTTSVHGLLVIPADTSKVVLHAYG